MEPPTKPGRFRMRKSLARRLRWMVLPMSLGSVGIAAAQTARPSLAGDIRHIPSVRLDSPEWPVLTGRQIRTLLSGRTLLDDEAYEAAAGIKVSVRKIGPCTQEIFFADGRWRMDQCGRGVQSFLGHWTTEPFRGAERLCVEPADPPVNEPKQCRFVWQGPSADQIIMPAGSEAPSGSYNLYRLVKTNPLFQ